MNLYLLKRIISYFKVLSFVMKWFYYVNYKSLLNIFLNQTIFSLVVYRFRLICISRGNWKGFYLKRKKNDNIHKNEVQDNRRSDEYWLDKISCKYYKLILQRIITTNFCGPVNHLRWSTISDLESPSNIQIKEQNYKL